MHILARHVVTFIPFHRIPFGFNDRSILTNQITFVWPLTLEKEISGDNYIIMCILSERMLFQNFQFIVSDPEIPHVICSRTFSSSSKEQSFKDLLEIRYKTVIFFIHLIYFSEGIKLCHMIFMASPMMDFHCDRLTILLINLTLHALLF